MVSRERQSDAEARAILHTGPEGERRRAAAVIVMSCNNGTIPL
jgi:hypothetical protein